MRRGGALIEMALVLPLLLMLSFGAVEYGYLLYVKNTLLGAAQNGVRAGIPATATSSDVTTAISNSMTAAGLASSGYTVTTSPTDVSTAAAGSTVQVTVSCTWNNVGVSPLPTWLGGIDPAKSVSGVAVMRKESN
jgi:Flp pilus assembly protein TadG